MNKFQLYFLFYDQDLLRKLKRKQKEEYRKDKSIKSKFIRKWKK